MRLVKMPKQNIRWAFNFTKWVPTDSEILISTACIQKEEKTRLAKFVFKKDFKASLCGRLMMRKFIHEITNFPYNDIIFKRDEKGKPFLDSTNKKYSDLSFNVSHQGDFAVLAGECSSVRLGVDVMKLNYAGGRNLNEFFHIMSRQFSNQEWDTIKGCGDEKQQITMFCRHWALKESYVKAIGVGITINLQDISFKIETLNLSKDTLVTDTKLYLKGVKQNWIFEEMLLDNEHCVAVALEKGLDESAVNSPKPMFIEIDFKSLIQNAIPLLPQDQLYSKNFFMKL